jgi:hypothetical protein
MFTQHRSEVRAALVRLAGPLPAQRGAEFGVVDRVLGPITRTRSSADWVMSTASFSTIDKKARLDQPTEICCARAKPTPAPSAPTAVC